MSTPFRFKNADNTTVDFEDYYVRADYFRSGNLWAWGMNSYAGYAYGVLGDNTNISKSSPVQTITRGTNWKQVVCHHYHTIATKTDGTLWTWGRNNYGQLGDNTITNKSSPVQTIAFGTNWKQISGGYSQTSAIKTDGTLWSWGCNLLGELGDNTLTSRSSPVQTIARGTNWMQVSADLATAAIKTDGTLWMWGRNTDGELGDNTIAHKSSPVQTVALGTNWKQVASGNYSTAAIKRDGTLWCCGSNAYGQLGDNTITSRSSPVQTVAGGTNWKQVACAGTYKAAIKTDGTLWVWGKNYRGSLGDNTIVYRSSPVQTIAFGTNWKQVDCFYLHTVAIKTDGTLWTWGLNEGGQLGNNTSAWIARSSPAQTIMYGTNWKQVACGYDFTAAIQYQDDYQ